jgi:hypothetical protein
MNFDFTKNLMIIINHFHLHLQRVAHQIITLSLSNNSQARILDMDLRSLLRNYT